MKKAIALVVLLFANGAARATVTDFNRTINQVGTELSGTTNRAYFSVNEALSSNCAFGIIYFDLAADWGKAAYATLLTARAAGNLLSRIDYNQPGGAGTACYLSLVELRN